MTEFRIQMLTEAMLDAVTATRRHAEKQQTRTIEEKEAENIIPVRIERQNDVFYVYHEKDSLFLAQGKSLEEIRDLLTKRFPGKRIVASNDNVKDVGIIS